MINFLVMEFFSALVTPLPQPYPWCERSAAAPTSRNSRIRSAASVEGHRGVDRPSLTLLHSYLCKSCASATIALDRSGKRTKFNI